MKVVYKGLSFGRLVAFFYIPVFLLGIFLTSCGDLADRDNPVDPDGNNYATNGTLVVQVNDSYGDGISEATVRVENTNQASFTDENGRTQLEVLPGDYTVLVYCDGFQEQRYDQTITLNENTSLTSTLNALPSIDSVWTITAVLQEDLNNFVFSYDLHLLASDHDGVQNIKEVRLYEPDSPIPFSDGFSNDGNHFIITRDFGTNREDMTSLFGKYLRLVIIDDDDDSTSVEYLLNTFFYYVSAGSLLQDDSGQQITSDSLHFVWKNPRFEDWEHWFYPHDFRLEIMEGTSPYTLVFDTLLHYDVVSDDFLNYTHYDVPFSLGDPLTARLTIFDPFGNYVRSLRKNYVIAEGARNE